MEAVLDPLARYDMLMEVVCDGRLICWITGVAVSLFIPPVSRGLLNM